MGKQETLYREALASYDREDYAAATALLRRFLERAPAHVEAHYKLANSLNELGDPAAAVCEYLEVLERDPAHAMAHNNLGAAEQSLGHLAEAERGYRNAIWADPYLPQASTNLGRLLESLGRLSEADEVYRQAIARGLSPELFGHLHAAASGETPVKAPPGYVQQTFDAIAPHFDQHLTEILEYRVPEHLAERLLSIAPQRRYAVLDLGCGTGRMGVALGSVADPLVGVDLSTGMLAVAKRHGIYLALHQADVGEWLRSCPPLSFDLVTATDVFIYIGDLASIFHDVARVLRPEGLFAFSVEATVADDWRLMPSGRYAQSREYVERLADDEGLAALHHSDMEIRCGVQGELYVFGRTGRQASDPAIGSDPTP
jgi:predicted TPR repeat methyltransferase